MTAVMTADRQKRQTKLERFTETAVQVLANYKCSVSRRVKKLETPSPDSSHEILDIVYEELSEMNRLFNRVFKRKHIISSMKSLIREYFTR